MVVMLLSACLSGDPQFHPINGFTDEANAQLKQFVTDTQNESGRKIAVFDGDGTVLGQAPHYLADEALYMYARDHPDYKPDLIREMSKQSNVSLPYVQNRVHYFAGMSLNDFRDLGEACYRKYYSGKIFQPMKDLINLLKDNNFEIWVISASPEGMYQQFLAGELDIPITHVIGVKSVINGGIITDEIIPPVPQDHGKKEAIESFVQDQPLLAAGNSRGDKEMIEFSRGLHLIVNPDEFVAPDQDESISDYARANNWLIVRVNDIPSPDFPSVSSKDFGIRTNRTTDFSTSTNSGESTQQK